MSPPAPSALSRSVADAVNKGVDQEPEPFQRPESRGLPVIDEGTAMTRDLHMCLKACRSMLGQGASEWEMKAFNSVPSRTKAHCATLWVK